MLSYRHAFHAGNHGDVLKHAILARVLVYVIQKPAPFVYIDTHAGAGQYKLNDSAALKTNDKDTGVTKIWNETAPPPLLQPYFEVLRTYNVNRELTLYPGSPLIAQHFMRIQDRAVGYELHPSDYQALNHTLISNRRFNIYQKNGFSELLSQLPPKERRGIILIDPSYEQIIEYNAVYTAINQAMKKFATGIYIIWYPLLNAEYATPLLHQLNALNITKTLRVEFTISTMNTFGLMGSGVWIINPPWLLERELRTALPWLMTKLGEFNAHWHIA
jgi:23S rRNA (adenine2030-N6)-methyltransferase